VYKTKTTTETTVASIYLLKYLYLVFHLGLEFKDKKQKIPDVLEFQTS
jgi:hypothetical protein